jgi:TetR/AcrR family transcriptional regulator, cholesterol catabolism regulator
MQIEVAYEPETRNWAVNGALTSHGAHPARMTPRQRDRRERLLDAGLDFLKTQEYEQVQVKEIAERAGVSLATLYNYFFSKERFFAEVLVRWAEGMPTNARRRPLAQASPAQRLRETVHRALRAFENHPQMARLVNVLVISSDPQAAELLARLKRLTSDAYMQALVGIDPLVARSMVEVINAVFGSSVAEWSRGRMTITEVYDRLDSAIALVVRV